MKKMIFLIFLILNSFCDDYYEELFSNKHRNKYLWGTYKPNLYFSLKEKLEKTNVFGLMWYSISEKMNKMDFEEILRHECNQKDNIKYFWHYHNGIDYGHEELIDEIENVNLNIKFVKREYDEENQSWDTEISVKNIKNNNVNKENIGLILYFALENFQVSEKTFYKIEKENDLEYKINLMKYGKLNAYMKISLDKESLKNEKIIYSEYQKYRRDYTQNWRIKQYIINELGDIQKEKKKKEIKYSFLPFDEQGSTKQPNVIAIQFVLPLASNEYKFNINFSTKENNIPSKTELQNLFILKEKLFKEKFSSIFEIKNTQIEKTKIRKLSEEALSNILGGIGYFYGDISLKIEEEEEENNYEKLKEKKGLFTGTPCRSFFARGFLWDEGFHNIIISKWDIKLSMDIINSWLNTMSINGYIPREQIRGFESENQVSKDFIAQNVKIANPPSLIFPINTFLQYYNFISEAEKEINMELFIKKIYNKLKLWFKWFEKTQKVKNNYQWYGRDSSHNFPSGLDDFPRAMVSNEEENHLDLNIWVKELLTCLKNYSNIIDKESTLIYEEKIKEIDDNIHKNLFNEELGIYSDFLGKQFKKIKNEKFPRKIFPIFWRGDGQCGINAKNALGENAECDPYSDKPCCSEFGWCGNTDNHCKCEKCVVSKKLENRKNFNLKEYTHNPHLGYINLFTLFFGFLNVENDKIAFENLLKYLNDENELYSNFGIRSLSKSDLLYHQGDDYWRGNIWICLNYLTLRGLYIYYNDKSEYAKKTYEKLRNNVINSIYKSWENTHIFYENYSDKNGKGMKNHPFNGWTSTIVNILSEVYY